MLVDAGALIDTGTYIGSAWKGCVDFESEQRDADWKRWEDCNTCPLPETPAGGVMISDSFRPRRRPLPGSGRSLERPTFPIERIDEILVFITERGHASASKFLDEAIRCSIAQQSDYTTMCLVRARETLGISTTLDCLDSVLACVKRWEAKPIQSREDCSNVYYFMQRRNYDAAGRLLLEDPDRNLLNALSTFGTSGTTLTELVKSGFASLVDTALTPEVMEKLKADPKSQEATGKPEQPSNENKAIIKSDEKLAQLLKIACLTRRPNMEVLRVLADGRRISVNVAANDHFYYGPGGGNTVLHALTNSPSLDWWQLHQALPYLLEKGADTEVRDGQGMTPLRLCLEKIDKPSFSKEMVELLLTAGANPNAVDNRERSCFALAMRSREVCELMLSHGAKVSHSALGAAITMKDPELLQIMLSREDVDPNMRKAGKHTPRKLAEDGRSFFEERYDPNSSDELYPVDYLLCSVSRDDKSDASARMFDLLLAHSANLAAKYERTTVVHRLLMNQGVSMNTTYSGENNLLLPTLKHPSLDIEIRDAEGSTLLLHACRHTKFKAVNTLLDRGADIHAKDFNGHSALHLLVASRNHGWSFSSMDNNADSDLAKETLERMLSLAPERLAEVDDDGRTPLHCSINCQNGLIRSDNLIPRHVNILIDAGADATVATTKTKVTPLHMFLGDTLHIDVNGDGSCVVNDKHIDLLHRFVSLGADINARNTAGETPAFNFFREAEVKATVPLSAVDKASVAATPRGDQSWATSELERERQRAAAVTHEHRLWEIFEQSGIDWKVTSKSGQTLLHIVAANVEAGHNRHVGRAPARFKFLMDRGVDVFAEDDKHQTALDIAAALGAQDILNMFKKN